MPSAWMMTGIGPQAGLVLLKAAEPIHYRRDSWIADPLYKQHELIAVIEACRVAGISPLRAMQWATRATDVTLTAQEVTDVQQIGVERLAAAYRYL